MTEIEPLVVRPTVARKMLGGCATATLWKLINGGQLESYTEGTARMITVASIKAYITRRLAAPAPSLRNGQPRRS